jgi:hypothetical protein
MNVDIGAEAALFPEKEYISGIFVAVWPAHTPLGCLAQPFLLLPIFTAAILGWSRTAACAVSK